MAVVDINPTEDLDKEGLDTLVIDQPIEDTEGENLLFTSVLELVLKVYFNRVFSFGQAIGKKVRGLFWSLLS